MNTQEVSVGRCLLFVSCRAFFRAGFVAELLCDAKDYSVHAKKTDIEAQDIKLAIKLNEVKISGVDSSRAVIEEMKNEINKQGLVDFVDPDAVLTRYPPDGLLQRNYTYVPGSECYGEVSGFRF
jgi:hypothetical protein